MTTTLSLQKIMTNAIADGLDIRLGKKTLPCRFSIVVSPATREFLEMQTLTLNQSLASLCGVILDQVVAETLKRAALRSVDQ